MSERNRGILTPNDREYLLGKREDIEGAYERRVRKQIRERILNAIIDFWILERCLDDNDLAQIFDPDRGKQTVIPDSNQREFPPSWYTRVHEEYRTGSPLQERDKREEPDPATTVFEEALKDAISFLYQGSEQLPAVEFEQIVEEGITKAVREHGKTASADIEIRDAELDDLIQKLEDGDLNWEEIPLLLDSKQ